ncbi:uncharacterized protein BX663DRAFT_514452 [Cokeromyces recurvatus]|uniref:uncharacterized protein n=1 Tax=Cokeromyces recurvatus TaxID=90255 RepID=UPI0022202D14|nr:uncharacterized protein BX663DRAFT_514452 [Cokeromyces recurvatus]KAI7901450.1 hypothetical protein BX663DRAFT_514452 [Cokeromyces recurvatus]
MSTITLSQEDQRKINSIRRKDKMWIYKNPKGLLLLENELNEKKKQRFARHRACLVLSKSTSKTIDHLEKSIVKEEMNSKNRPKLHHILEPKSLNIPVVKNDRKKEFSNDEKIETKSYKEKQQLRALDNSKQDKSADLSSSKQAYDKSSTTVEHNFLIEAKQKLLSAQKRIDTTSSVKKASMELPVKKKGLVVSSSVVSVFEVPSTNNKDKKLLVNEIKSPIVSKSASLISSKSIDSNCSLKQTEYIDVRSPASTASSTALVTPYTPTTKNNVSYFSLPSHHEKYQSDFNDKVFQQEVNQSIIINTVDKDQDTAKNDASINMYLPQLSPEISFCNDDTIMSDLSESEDHDTIQQKQVTSSFRENNKKRSHLKKQVSFSDQMLTYIPEQQYDNHSLSSCSSSSSSASSVDTPAASTSESTILPVPIMHDTEVSSNRLLNFSHTIRNELSNTKEALIAEGKVNVTSSRNKFVPVAIRSASNKLLSKTDGNTKQNSIVNTTPQRLSNRLLNIFQSKASNNAVTHTSYVASNKQSTKLHECYQQAPPAQELIHLTKTRPRKPPSLRKPTYPAATAQPNWRIKATNKKYEFVRTVQS